MAQKRAQLRAPSRREHNIPSWRQRVYEALCKPVDAAGLVYFRIAFGAVILGEVLRLIENNWAGRNFSDKNFYFTYWPFDFVHPWPGVGMQIHLYGTAIVAICISVALFYRISTTLFFCLLTYLFLVEKALYLNHFYFICLLAFLMIVVPAHRYCSLDAFRQPNLRAPDVPAWSLWLLRFQVGIVYFYGGIAKINMDWLRGQPLRQWLSQRTDFPLLGPLFTNDAVVWVMTYGSLCLDLFVGFLLLNRRTRVFGYVAALIFHFMNARLFNIGAFPWIMIALTAVFFEPDWPRQMLRVLRHGPLLRRLVLLGAGGLGLCIGAWLPKHFTWMHVLIGTLGGLIAAQHFDEPFRRPEPEVAQPAPAQARAWQRKPQESRQRQPWLFAFLGIWVMAQVLIPLRHFIIPGNVHWTEEGHRFSWHMLLRAKDSGGYFVIVDSATGKTWYIDPQDYLSSRQQRKMISHPGMIVQFARYLAERMRRQGHQNVAVRANILTSLNGREAQPLIDPDVDLTKVPYPWWGHAEWIPHLTVPLPERQN